jgi:CubicO group peptidase (beta-lactamase class C family)
MTRRSWLVCLLSLLLPARAASPDSAKALQGFDGFMEQAMKELQVPGAAAGVMVDGKIILARGYGIRSVTRPTEVTADTAFAIGSVTKSFTAAVLATPVDERKLEWDKPVREYLPWFRMYDPIATELMTPRDLLTHRSGLPRHDFIRFSTPLDRGELVHRLRYLENSRTFRDVFQYNNLMYVTAGYLAGEIAGATWEELVARRIFEPLGMANSFLRVTDMRRSGDFARPHDLAEGAAKEIEFYDYQKFGVGPNGAVNSSVNDMLKYLGMYLDGGKSRSGQQIVSTGQLNELWRPVMVSGPTSTYALGWSCDSYYGHRMRSHGGAINGFTSHVMVFPEDRIGIVVLNNLGSALPGIVSETLADRLLAVSSEDRLKKYLDNRQAAAAKSKPPNQPEQVRTGKPSLDLAAYEGDYANPAYGTIHVQRDSKTLKAVFPAVTVPLEHYNFDTFTFDGDDGQLARFELDPQGRVARLLLPLEPAVKPFDFERIR